MPLNEFIENCLVKLPPLLWRSMKDNMEYSDSERLLLASKHSLSSVDTDYSALGPEFVQYTDNLVHEIVDYYVEEHIDPKIHQSHVRLITICSKLNDKLFDHAIERLDVNAENCEQTFFRVAESLFSDKVFNWGRLISLFAFAGKLTCKAVKSCFESKSEIKQNMCNSVSKFINRNLSKWIIEKGGWVS